LLLIPVNGLGITTWEIGACGVLATELYFRKVKLASAALALAPWLYLALGIQMAIVYNMAIVSVRPFNLYDSFFQRLDATIFGVSVAGISHSVASFSHASPSLYLSAEIIYFAIGGVMGAALLFLCMAGDCHAAFQMAGTIVTAYYLSLMVFWAWPSHGPYLLDPVNALSGTNIFSIQQALHKDAAALYHHRDWVSPVFGYFVAFPSMHVVQPLIAGWYLRRWRRVSQLVFAYCGLLVFAIIILEWHYLVDILGGILIAVLATMLASISWGSLPFWRSKPDLVTEI
jgi:hypothetical protein